MNAELVAGQAVVTEVHSRSRLFLVVALGSSLIAVLGFVPTYWYPLASGAAGFEPLTHIHALFLFGWFVLLSVQASLISRKRVALHRAVGVFGIAWVAGAVAVGYLMVRRTLIRDIGLIDGTFDGVFTIIPLTQLVMFACLFTAGIATRKDPDVHRRFITLAALVAVTPALARIGIVLLGGQSPLLVASLFLTSNGLVVAAAWYDASRNGRVHPVFLWGGLAILVVRIARVPFSMTPWWTALAHAISR